MTYLTDVLNSRTRLTAPPILGVGTAFVECLTSWIVRVAESHFLSVSTLLSKVIAPEIGRDPRPIRRTEHLFVLNGSTGLSPIYVEALERLTGLRGLSQTTYAPLVHRKVLPHVRLSRVKRWCVQCLQDADAARQPFSEPLLFQLANVGVCPRHGCELNARCSHCGKGNFHLLPLLGLNGFCPRCFGWLGDASFKRLDTSSPLDRYRLWISQSAAELVAVLGQPEVQFQPVARMLDAGIHELFQGNANRFARAIQRSKSTVSEWRHGRILPDFRALCEISFVFHVPLLSLASGDVDSWNVAVMRSLPIPHTSRPSRTRLDAKRRGEILRALTALATGRDTERLSLMGLASDFRVDVSTLFDVDPMLAERARNQIRANYKRALDEAAAARSRTLQAAIDTAFAYFRRIDIYPSRRKVLMFLKRQSFVLRRSEYSLLSERTKASFPLGRIAPTAAEDAPA